MSFTYGSAAVSGQHQSGLPASTSNQLSSSSSMDAIVPPLTTHSPIMLPPLLPSFHANSQPIATTTTTNAEGTTIPLQQPIPLLPEQSAPSNPGSGIHLRLPFPQIAASINPPGIPGLPGRPLVGQYSAMNPFPHRPGYPNNPLMPPAGMARYPPMYSPMVRTSILPARPHMGRPLGSLPLIRPMGTMIRHVGAPLKYSLGISAADMSKVVGQFIPEKPQTTVYVGKIASTIDDEFLRSTLELCGQVKSWKRAQDPSNGTPKGFGFCEFEMAEGVLRAMRLLNKLSIEGQELVLNVTKATREYLDHYVSKKTELEKERKEARSRELDREEVETAPGVDKVEPVKQTLAAGESVKDDTSNLSDNAVEENGKKFGLVNDDDHKLDEEAQKKLTAMLEERAKQRPLPPPPPLPETPTKSNSVSGTPAKSKDIDSIADATKSDGLDGRNEDDTVSENKLSLESEFLETSSSYRAKHLDRSGERESRDRDRERDGIRDKDREFERYERERERERLRRERDREMRHREAERRYEERERHWEEREREKERQRQVWKEKEKERERERRREIRAQEEECDDENWRKRRHRGDLHEEMRKRRRREMEDDGMDRLKEEQEIAEEAKWQKMTKETEITKKAEVPESLPILNIPLAMEVDVRQESLKELEDTSIARISIDEKPLDGLVIQNGTSSMADEGFPCPHVDSGTVLDEGFPSSHTEIEEKQSISPAPRKLGFGLVGSGKRTAVPCVFTQDNEEESYEDLKSRPLIPIDYSAEEMEAVALSKGSVEKNPSNHTAKEERRGRVFNKHEQDHVREKDRVHVKEELRERSRDKVGKHHQKGSGKSFADSGKPIEPKKPLDAKQLIDSIPKTKEELFAFNIDWTIYDKNNLHERLRPWISKKIAEYLGEEETTLVDYIVSNTRKHVTAAHMLELLNSIFDDEAEMFVLKMWRMLIFEVRKVEIGLASKMKA